MQQVEQLALVFVDALDLHVEQALRVDRDAGGAFDVGRQTVLVRMFDGCEPHPQRRVLAQAAQALQLVQIEPPGPSQGVVQQCRQARVGLRQPAPRRDTVGHVGETFRPQAGEVGKDGLDQQVGVQRRHAVDLVAADNGQVGHAHPAFAVFVDQRQACQEPVVARPVQGRRLQELLVDAKDDLEVAWQHMLHQADRPGLQCLGHQGVVGVGEGPRADLPRAGPGHALFVAQHPHEFGHADGRVRVVEVDRHLVGQVVQARMFFEVAGDHVLD